MRFAHVLDPLLSPETVLQRGLWILNVRTVGKSFNWQENKFKSEYGTTPVVMSKQWNDLCLTGIERAMLTAEQKSFHGFKAFLVMHYFLRHYPANASTFATHFKVPEYSVQGRYIWDWVEKLAALKGKVIVWTEDLDSKDCPFNISLDGTDYRANEKKHPRYNQDKQDCSHKFNHGALKYEIGLSIWEPRCVWINGPHRGGKSDLQIFRERLVHKLKPWNMVVCDRGYQTSEPFEEMVLRTPSGTDSKELAKFKSRARLRHETFNGRLKTYKILANTYRHAREKHRFALEAIAVTVQYEMNNGNPIFDVL